MANELDELNSNEMGKGNDIKVIAKQIPVKVGAGSIIFEVLLWILGIIPGIVFLFMKINAKKELDQLQQRIQHDASQIDNYMEQRVQELTNAARLLDKSIDLDKDVMTKIAAYRGGVNPSNDSQRNEIQSSMDQVAAKINIVMENYPNLEAHKTIEDCMQKNSYLQREITAAREVYNDSVLRWNQEIFEWPTKKIVASRNGYTTRVPFVASKEVKDKARSTFF